MLNVITFDLDDTLWDVWPIILRAEARMQDWLTEHYPRITDQYSAKALREVGYRIAREQPEIAHDKTEMRLRGLRRVAEEQGYTPELAEAAYKVFFTARNEVDLFPDVLPVIQALADQYTLGALSNGNADLSQTPLGPYFDFHFNAIQVGAEKPDPAMFQATLEHTGAAPERIVHIGDHHEHDILGAQKLGLRTIWVNRKGEEWAGARPADAEIRDLSELPAALAQLNGLHSPHE